MTEETKRRISIKIRLKGGDTLVYNPKPWITPLQAARCGQILPVLFHGPSRDLDWRDIINELGINGHFDLEQKPAEPEPVADVQTVVE